MTERQQTRRYRFSNDAGAASTRDDFGNYILRKGVGQCYKPAYGLRVKNGQTLDGVTILRLLPHLEPGENGAAPNWCPFRYSAEERDYGDWIRSYKAVRSIGPEGNVCTFIVSDPARDGDNPDLKWPSEVLYHNINQAVRAGVGDPTWAPMIMGVRGGMKALKPCETITLVKSAIVYMNGTTYMSPPKGITNPLVMELTGSASAAILAEINKPVTAETLARRTQMRAQGQYVSDWGFVYECGDPLSLTDGVYLTVYKRGDGDPRTRAAMAAAVAQQQGAGFNFAGNQQQAGGNAGVSTDANSYACYAEEHFQNFHANAFNEPAAREQLMGSAKSFDELLFFPTVEQQLDILVRRFPLQMFEYAYQSRPDWMQHIRNELGLVASAQGFGMTPPAVTTMPAGFGQQPQQPQQSVFGGQPQQSVFGGQPQQPAFGAQPQQPVFGAQPTQQVFGATQPQPVMGGQPGAFAPVDSQPAFTGQPQFVQPQQPMDFGGQPQQGGFSGQPQHVAQPQPAQFGQPQVFGGQPNPVFGAQQPQSYLGQQPGAAAAPPPFDMHQSGPSPYATGAGMVGGGIGMGQVAPQQPVVSAAFGGGAQFPQAGAQAPAPMGPIGAAVAQYATGPFAGQPAGGFLPQPGQQPQQPQPPQQPQQPQQMAQPQQVAEPPQQPVGPPAGVPGQPGAAGGLSMLDLVRRANGAG